MGVLAAIRGLVRSEEDLATLAVAHVLRSSPRARRALNAWLAIDEDVEWVEQDIIESDEEGRPRPDLVGYLGTEQVAFIEAKFDAGLTGNQPVEYLRRLSAGGHVAMLVPQRRLSYLTDEVLRRLNAAGLEWSDGDEGWHVNVDEAAPRRLSFRTWDQLVRHLLDATRHPDARAAHDDLQQIRELVDEVQDRLFEPLSAQELTDGVLPRTISQLLSVFNDLKDELVGRGLERHGQHAAHISGQQNFGIKQDGHELIWVVNFGLEPWKQHAPTPFWLAVHWTQRDQYDHLLRPLLEGAPPRAYWMDTWNNPGVGIPLTIEDGKDRAALLASLADQIEHWIQWGLDAWAASEHDRPETGEASRDA